MFTVCHFGHIGSYFDYHYISLIRCGSRYPKLTPSHRSITIEYQVALTTLLTHMAEVKHVIAFYSHRPEKYTTGEEHLAHFSNFSVDKVTYQGISYLSAEHAFQCQKPLFKKDAERIAACATPMDCAKMGRDRSIAIQPDWDNKRLTVMWEVLLCKFTQNQVAYQALLATGDAYLEERTSLDWFWGSGSDSAGGEGKNMLGRMLVELRTVLKKY